LRWHFFKMRVNHAARWPILVNPLDRHDPFSRNRPAVCEITANRLDGIAADGAEAE
jgi:hypothetical protein